MPLLLDKAAPPDDAVVAEALGPAAPRWAALRATLATRHAPLVEKWSWSGKAYGWTLKLEHRKRAVVYLTPEAGWFRASLALGEEAVATLLASDLPAAVRAMITSAPRYPEGRAARVEVRSDADVELVLRLVEARMG